MASSNADLKTRIATLRHEILSYKPGKAVSCDDERVVFPKKLVVGMIEPFGYAPDIIPALRRALHGDVKPSKHADKRQTSTDDEEEYLTDYISVVITKTLDGKFEKEVQDLAWKVGCMVLFVHPFDIEYYPRWIEIVKRNTGLVPLCAILSDEDIRKARNGLKQLGITDMYEIPEPGFSLSDDDQLQWLDLLRGCLYKGDRTLAANDLKKMCTNPRCTLFCEKTKKEVNEAKEANHKMFTEVQEQNQELKKGREEDRERSEKEKRSLAAEMTKKLESKQQHVDTLTQTVGEKERNETTLTQQVEELKKGREEDGARSEKERRSLAEDMTKKLESKQHHVDTLTETVREKERNETTLRQQVEELKRGREEDRVKAEKDRGRSEEAKRSLAEEMRKELDSKQQHVNTLTETVGNKERNETTLTQQVKELEKGRKQDRARSEKEKRSLAADMTKKLDSQQHRVDTLIETVREKERNETTLRQQVEELKKEHDYKEQLLEQLERETWKLRTKIQLESEMRSAEQKKKAETHQWSFIPWVTSGKQAQGDKSSFEDNSTGGLGRSETLQAGQEPPDDEFAGILQQIADDLYDEAKIDSLAGQLGILQGDIQRALMTNMRFGRVTSDGTRHMLKQWRRGVSRKDERIELTKALHAAKLVNLADLYLSEGVAEEQIDSECANEDVNYKELSNRDETSLEQDLTKGHTDIQVLQEASASSNYTPRDERTGDTATKTQEELTDGSKSKHIDQSPERSTEDLDESEVTSEEVSSEEVHPGDDMNIVSSIQPSEQLPSHEMQDLPEDMSEIAPLVSYGGKPNDESNTLDTSHVGGIISNEEDLISQLVLTDTSPEKILLIFLVKIVMDASQKAFSL